MLLKYNTVRILITDTNVIETFDFWTFYLSGIQMPFENWARIQTKCPIVEPLFRSWLENLTFLNCPTFYQLNNELVFGSSLYTGEVNVIFISN